MNNEHTPEPERSDREKELISLYDEAITQRDELAAALRKIMNAHNSGNNGAYMGEATVCPAFAIEANAALAKLEGGPQK